MYVPIGHFKELCSVIEIWHDKPTLSLKLYSIIQQYVRAGKGKLLSKE